MPEPPRPPLVTADVSTAAEQKQRSAASAPLLVPTLPLVSHPMVTRAGERLPDSLGIPRSSIYDLIERSPHIRLAGDLSVEELTRCFHACQGDLDAMVQRLEVSKRSLNRRIKELGLVPKQP